MSVQFIAGLILWSIFVNVLQLSILPNAFNGMLSPKKCQCSAIVETIREVKTSLKVKQSE